MIDFGDIAFLLNLIGEIDLSQVSPMIVSSVEAIYSIGAKAASEAAANISSLEAADLVGLEEFIQ